MRPGARPPGESWRALVCGVQSGALVVKLVIVHHHFRPGGVRRVIELATPHLVAYWPEPIRKVVLAAGEEPEAAWLRSFRSKLRGARVTLVVQPSFGYRSELGRTAPNLSQGVAAGIAALVRAAGGEDCLIWAHNLGLGRNLELARELARACHRRGIPLVAHHHDWWFENRWHHFAASRGPGFRTLAGVANAVLPASTHISHAAINRADAAVLRRHFHNQAGWLPNPVSPPARVSPKRVAAVRAWLRRELNEEAPIWLLPCRLLRRKNIAEALLLSRWLRPEAWLITTGGSSSAEEAAYARALHDAARKGRWRLRLGILQGDQNAKWSVPELLAASEAVLLTSLQEGFGLPYLEAAAAQRPLVARELPNIAPDLARFGFTFPQSYREIRVDPALFDWRSEQQRQARAFVQWKRLMPAAAARLVAKPAVLAAGKEPRPVPFSRLTLAAQLEVLAQPVQRSWERCLRLNPFLKLWRQRAAAGTLQISPWPPQAQQWLGGRAYARRFLSLVPPRRGGAPRPGAGQAAQADFLRQKLRANYLYPLLWSPRT